MENKAEIANALAESLNRWSEALHSRSNRVSMFSNSAGWRQFYTVFHPIDVSQAIFYFSEAHGTYVADYRFRQDAYITEAFPGQAEAFACIDFFLRDSKIHHHQAIWLQGRWQVLSRVCRDSEDPDDLYQCDRFATVAGKTQCVNDYDCREDDAIALSQQNAVGLIRPDALQLEVSSSDAKASFLQGQLYFTLGGGHSGQPLQYVEVQFHLTHRFRKDSGNLRADARVSFYQTSDLDVYRSGSPEQAQASVLEYLHSAIAAVKKRLQQDLGADLADPVAFPDDETRVQALLDEMWQSVQTEYTDF